MVKRRDLVRELLDAGYEFKGGANHEIFTKDGKMTVVPRHREIKESTASQIRKQAGLK